MKINLHKNARTTPAQRTLIQNNTHARVADLAAQFGVSETTIRRWKNRKTPFDSPHTPKTIRKALTPLVELAIILLRVTLRLSLDDLLQIVRCFIYPACSRSGLNRCLKRYGVSRLPSLKKELPVDLNDYRGTYFFYSNLLFADPEKPGEQIWIQVLLDSFSRYVIADISERFDPSNLSFLNRSISQYPFNILGIIRTDPIILGNRMPGSATRGNTLNVQVENYCRLNDLPCYYLKTVAPSLMSKFHTRWAAMTIEEQHLLSAHLSQNRPLILKHIRTYNLDLPLKTLRRKTPFQMIEQHFNSFPGSFKSKRDYFARFFK